MTTQFEFRLARDSALEPQTTLLPRLKGPLGSMSCAVAP